MHGDTPSFIGKLAALEVTHLAVLPRTAHLTVLEPLSSHRHAHSLTHRRCTCAHTALRLHRPALLVREMPTRPTVVLLGTPKAGTSTLHACLTALDSICCKWNKEPAFFLAKQWHANGSNTTFEGLSTPNSWPPTGASHHQHVLDFTPSYLSRAWQSIRPLQQTYGDGRGLHLLVLLREPISRAFSEYCMFAPSAKTLLNSLRTRAACALPISGLKCTHSPRDTACTAARCMNDTGFMWPASCWESAARAAASSRGAIWCRTAGRDFLGRAFEANRRSILDAFPDAAARDGTGLVNRTALAVRLFDGGRLRWAAEREVDVLSKLVMPGRDPACAQGWGWNRDRRSFTEQMESQIGALTSRLHNCTLRPDAALSMTPEGLERYVQRCFRVGAINADYALHSVPVFQLARLLNALPRARWTFVQYEALYGAASSELALRHLVSRLGLSADAIRQQPECRLVSGHGSHRNSFVAGASADATSTERPSAGLVGRSERGGGVVSPSEASTRGPAAVQPAARPSPSYNRTHLAALIAPWYEALLAVVRQSNGTIIGWGHD